MSVIEWLLDSDPSIRWQVMRGLIAESDATVARERSRVAEQGWGARLLDVQGSDDHCGGAAYVARGRWPLENPHPGPVHFDMKGHAGEPSRWNTLRALRVAELGERVVKRQPS